MKKKRDNFVDILKFVFAVCVIGIHTGVLYDFSERTNWFVTHLIFRLAVPFFITTSAYYLGIKLNNTLLGDNTAPIFNQYRLKLVPPLILWGG